MPTKKNESEDLYQKALTEVRKELFETFQKYKIVADNTTDWVFWISPGNKLIYCSPSCKQITGYEPEEFENKPDLLLSIILPEDQKAFTEHQELIEKSREISELKFRIIKKTGETRWIQHICRPIYSGTGVYLGIRGSNRDVTAWQQTEDALLSSETRYRTLVETATDLISIYDMSGKFLYTNPAIETVLGYSPEEAANLSVFDIIPDNSLPDVKERRQKRIDLISDTHRYEINLKHKNGTLVPFDVSSSVFYDKENKLLNLSIARNISTQKKTESSLKVAEEKYRSIVENVQEGIFQTSIDGHFIMGNSALAKILKYADTDELLARITSLSDQLYAEPGHRDILIGELIEKGFVNDFLSLVYCKDGSKIWISENVKLIKKPDGSPDFLEGTLIDVTSKKETEQKLNEMVNEFSSLIEGIPDSIFFKDFNGRWLIINSVARKLFRLEQIDWQGKTDQELAELQPEMKSAFEACILSDRKAWNAGERIDIIEIVKDTDGNPHYFETTKIPLFEGTSPFGLVIIGRDITQQRQARETIHEQGLLLDHASDAIIVTDLEFRIQYWNKSAEKMYGWKLGDIIGKPIDSLLARHQNGTEERRSIIHNKGEWSGELSHQNIAGAEIVVESRQNIIVDSSGEPKSILHINSDITDKKRLERQFLRAQRMESIGRMASGIAHDLNNILSPILISVQRFQDLNIGAEHQNWINMLENNVQRAATMMKQLLMFSRGVEGIHSKTDIQKVIRDVEKIVKSTFPKNITVICSIDQALWPVLGDATQLHQVILNLAVNARDAMPAGGQLFIEAENVVFHQDYIYRFTEAKPGNYILVKVTDSGVGISPDIMDKIFDPFFTTKDLEKGTGLGLSTVAAIAKSHQGFVNVYSEVGQGAQFKLYIPALTTDIEENEPDNKILQHDGKGTTILIVDDEEPILSMLSAVLADYNYKVLTATDGIQAIGLFTTTPDIQVVITDMNMPKMDGATLIRTLHAIRPGLSIIATSGLPERDIHHEDIRRMIVSFLMKPYRTEAVLKELARILES
ncbi:MAG: PAS domain S-box protein [Bacteroidetes bacterium]|nr:PAS domain S-box protein [Bacteroidota bacterium]